LQFSEEERLSVIEKPSYPDTFLPLSSPCELHESVCIIRQGVRNPNRALQRILNGLYSMALLSLQFLNLTQCCRKPNEKRGEGTLFSAQIMPQPLSFAHHFPPSRTLSFWSECISLTQGLQPGTCRFLIAFVVGNRGSKLKRKSTFWDLVESA